MCSQQSAKLFSCFLLELTSTFYVLFLIVLKSLKEDSLLIEKSLANRYIKSEIEQARLKPIGEII